MPAAIGKPKERIPRTAKNEALVVRAKTLTAHAKEYRRSHREQAWVTSEQQWNGRQWALKGDQITPEGDQVTVNVSFSTINTILPYITGSDPSFIVEPYGGKADPRNARLLQALINRIWRSNRVSGNQHLRRASFDYLLVGDGYLKVSYTLDKVWKPGSTADAVVANLWVDRLDPRDVWIDPDSDGLHNARYVVVRTFKSVADLQEDRRYKNTAELSAFDDRGQDVGGTDSGLSLDTGDDRDQMVAIYEFYDIPSRILVTFTEQADLPLQVVEGIDCPIVAIANHIIPNCPYHMGELEQIQPLQDELNKTRTQMVEHRMRNAQKWAARRGSLDAKARDALKSAEVNAVVEVDGDQLLNDMVVPLQVPNLTADVYQIDQIIKGDVYEITGVNEYLRGATPDIRRTATEATIIEGATNVKTAQKLRLIEAAARQVGQLMLDTAAAVYPLTDADEMSLILTGKDAQAVRAAEGGQEDPSQLLGAVLTPSADLFEGTYEVFVEQGSTELRNPVLREQKYKEMLTIFMQAQQVLAMQGVQVNLRKIVELWLEAAGVDDIDAVLGAAESQPGTPAMGPGYPGGSPALQAGAPNVAAATPPVMPPSPMTSGMMPPVS
jgi:hypothetical protein